MLYALIVTTAWADPPDQTRALLSVTSGDGAEVERMVVGAEGDIVVGRVRGTLEGWLLDMDTWAIETFDDCDVTGVVPIRLEDGTDEVWMSCVDGSVRGKWWHDRQLEDVRDEDDAPVVLTGIDDTLSSLWYHVPADPNQPALLYAVASKDGTNSMVHAIDPFALTVDATALAGFPTPLTFAGFNEGTVTNDILFVNHVGRDNSYLPLGVANPVAAPSVLTQATGCDDMFPSPFETAVYCVAAPEGDPTALGAAFLFRPQVVPNGVVNLPLGDLVNPNAIGVSRVEGDRWLAVTGTQVKVWAMNEDSSIEGEPVFIGAADAQNPIQEIETTEGYLLGGGVGGNVHVVSARPWSSRAAMKAEPATAVDGEVVTLTFEFDEAVDYEVRLNGDRAGTIGTVLESGSAPAETEQTVSLTVGGAWAEGDNELFVIGTNDRGLTGHGMAIVSVDNPPDPPVLTAKDLVSGDESLVLDFEGIDDEDLVKYEVYVSVAPFVEADWPVGGPPFDGDTQLTTPIDIPSLPGARVSYRIAPLENGVTYHVAVRARDASKEGPMSQILTGTPEKTYSVSEWVGDPGGSPCATGSPSAGWLVLFGVAGAAVARRRAARVAAAAVVAVGLAGASGAAHAQTSDDEDPWWRQDMTPARANFQIRYGVINLVDTRVEDFYTEGPANLLQAEFGPQLWRIGEIDLGFGFLQELSYQRRAGGLDPAVGDRTMLTWFPLSLDATLRAHILDEQPAVPFIRYGWDYVIWSEKWDNASGTKDALRGAKFGAHTSLGVDLLLDLIQPGRASFLEAQTGINDSWLTIEWRRQRVDSRRAPWGGRNAPDDRLDFSGDALMLGLKLDW